MGTLTRIATDRLTPCTGGQPRRFETPIHARSRAFQMRRAVAPEGNHSMSTQSNLTGTSTGTSHAPSSIAANDNRTDGAFIIETGDVAAGIVVRQAKNYRFFSAHHDFRALDGSIFTTPKAAQKAAELVHASIRLAAARRRNAPEPREAGR